MSKYAAKCVAGGIKRVSPSDLRPNSLLYRESPALRSLLHELLRKGGADFWRSLPLMNEGLLRHLYYHPVQFVVLTAPPSGSYHQAYKGKQDWVEENLRPILLDTLVGFICCGKKGHFNAPNALLIDDREKNCREFKHSLLIEETVNHEGFTLPPGVNIIYLDLDGCFADVHAVIAPTINNLLRQAAEG